MRRRRLGRAVLGAAMVALLGAACSSSDDTGGGGTTLEIVDFSFEPSTLQVPSGSTTITITNNGAVEHSFTLDDDSVSQDVEPGETATVTVDLSADAPFHCEYHPDQMTGTLTVG
jgi:plastocyanin